MNGLFCLSDEPRYVPLFVGTEKKLDVVRGSSWQDVREATMEEFEKPLNKILLKHFDKPSYPTHAADNVA